MLTRCTWCTNDPLYMEYHDKEWGVPVHDDQTLFEFLILESMQAGLSWITILRKRENFRKAFDNFNAEKIARYSEKKIQKLLTNPGIIRHDKKILAAVNNAKCFLKLQNEFNSFAKYLWQFTNHKTIHNTFKRNQKLPATSAESDALAKDLKKRGFTFLGSTTCYAYMQAVGMINDHVVECFKHTALNSN